jgi:ribosomal protein L29
MRHRSGVIVEQTDQIRKLRRDIARMKTIAAERERLA